MKNTIIKNIFLLIFPLILGYFLFEAKMTQGTFNLGHNADPSYVYLFNSMNLAHGYLPGHVDHPGTVLQYLGAVVLRVIYWVDGTAPTLIEDVMQKPEKYLSAIANVAIFLNVLAMFIFGFLTDKYTKKLWIGVFLQISPLFFIDILVLFVPKVCAESLLLIPVMGISCLSILFWFKDSAFTNNSKYIWAFALLLSFGIITKITFIPFGIIPLLLIASYQRKMYFILVTFLLLVLIGMPAFFSYEYLFAWIKGLWGHSGHYGNGEKKFLDNTTFFVNIGTIMGDNKNFVVVLRIIFLLFVAYIVRLKAFWEANPVLCKKTGIFFFIFVVMLCVNVLFVAKHYRSRYLIPLFGFTYALLPIFYLFLQELLKDKVLFSKIALQKVAIVFCIGVLALMTWNIKVRYQASVDYFGRFTKGRTETQMLANKLENAIFLYYYSNSSDKNSLVFGINIYAAAMRGTYYHYLHKMHPEMIEFNPSNGWCRNNDQPIGIKEIIKKKKRVFLYGSTPADTTKIKIRNSDTEELTFPIKLIQDTKTDEFIYEVIY